MKFKLLLFSILVSSFTFLLAEEQGFVPLFDSKTLNGWTAAKSTPEQKHGAFSVNEEEKSIHTYQGENEGSEQISDCLNTEKEYSYFILKLEYKWLGKRYAPRTDWDRDAGLLFHVHGDLKKVWPSSVEMQIGESPGDKPNPRRFHSGDLFVLGKNLRAKTPRTGGQYDPEGTLTTGKGCKTKLGVEKPKGEWNQMEIHVHGAEKATFILNGEVVLEVFDMEQKNEKGEFVPLEKGRIGLQAEWAEILYRNILIKELPAPK